MGNKMPYSFISISLCIKIYASLIEFNVIIVPIIKIADLHIGLNTIFSIEIKTCRSIIKKTIEHGDGEGGLWESLSLSRY